jgi:hypothetical protein
MTRTNSTRKTKVGVFAAGLCLAGGIGFIFLSRPATRAAAQGKVTLDNKPLDQAVIVFVPLPPLIGKQTGAEVKQGKYRIDGEVGFAPGEYRVEIHPYISPVGADGKYADRATTKRLAASLPTIPRQYRSGSTLKVTAGLQANQFNFDLSSKPDSTNISSSP